MKKLLVLLLASFFLLASCEQKPPVDIINSDAEFLYFFGETCPHCQELNKKITEEELLSKISVEKREVYFNNKNREIFVALTNKLKVKKSDAGVPFVYDKVSGEYAVGVGPAFELLKSRVSDIIETPVETNTGTTDTGSIDAVETENEASSTGTVTE